MNFGGCPVHGQTHGIATYHRTLVEYHSRGPVVWVVATSGWTSEEAPCTGRHTALRRITGPRWSITHEVPWFGWQQPRRKPRARGLRRGLGQTRDQSAVGVERKLWSYLGVSPEVAICLVPRQHRQVGWSLKREVPWFGWQQPRGDPPRMHRARGVRRGLGQFWDESAVRVGRKRWSYLGVSPEVAVCLVPRQHRQISSLAEDLPWPSVNLSWPRGKFRGRLWVGVFRRHNHL